MNSITRKLLIVVDSNETCVSLLSIGDIQRAILSNKDLNLSIKSIFKNEERIIVSNEDSFDNVKSAMWHLRSEFMPRISSYNTLKMLFFSEWSEYNKLISDFK